MTLIPTACTQAPASQPAVEAVDILISDVAVVDAEAGVSTPGQYVGIADGRIAGIWDEASLPADLEVASSVDGSNQWMIPGLWDGHVHFRGGEGLLQENRDLLRLYPAFGVTTVRDAGGDLTDHVLAWRDSIRSGLIIGPEILTSGPKLDGPRPSWPGSISLSDPSQVTAAIDSLESLGVDFVKLYDGSMIPEVFMESVRETERRGIRVTGHMPLAVDFLEALESGYDGTEHLYYVYKGTASNRVEVGERVRAGDLGFWGAFWEMLGKRDPEREAQVAAAMVERGAVVIPTLHIGDVLSTVELTDHSMDGMLELIPEGIQATYQRRLRSAQRSSSEVRDNNRRLRGEMRDLWLRLHEAGVITMAGSDAGPYNSYVYPGASLLSELIAMVDAGITPAEALQTATINAATFMGRDGELGRIVPGYVADLVLLDADPLEDIRALRSRSAVVLKGDLVLDRVSLDALLTPGPRE